MARSLNKVILIGNLTRDPELKYTPQGTAVATFGLATNRTWTTDTGEKKESVEFHNIVAWNKLAELASQYLSKGRRVYVEGRLQTRKWTGKDDVERRNTEIVISDILFLDPKGGGGESRSFDVPEGLGKTSEQKPKAEAKEEKQEKSVSKKKETKSTEASSEADEDIPF